MQLVIDFSQPHHQLVLSPQQFAQLLSTLPSQSAMRFGKINFVRLGGRLVFFSCALLFLGQFLPVLQGENENGLLFDHLVMDFGEGGL